VNLFNKLKSMAAAAAAVILFASPALAQTYGIATGPLSYQNFTLSTASSGLSAGNAATGTTNWLALTGEGTCSVSFQTVGTGGSFTVQGAADTPNAGTFTYQTVTGIGTSGVITSPAAGSAYGGSILPQAITYIRLNMTAISSGTYSGSLSCTNAPGGSSSGTTTVTNTAFGTAAVTGLGATHYAATSVTAGTANTISSSAATLYEILISWSAPSSAGTCYVTVYNSASPTVGTGFVEIFPISTALPGIIAVDPPPTVGGAYTTAISYAITTTPTGTTACNTTASQLYAEAWYK
jgi:hypothetical protein